MLSRRIIPCLDVKGGRVVKGVHFVGLKDAGDPVENAIFYNEEGADELIFLDITASHERRPIILEVVERTAENVFMPLTVGGGIRCLSDIRALLKAGADKISINTEAVRHPRLIQESSREFGNQCIVVAIDAKRYQDQKGWEVFIEGGRRPTGREVIQWAKEVERLGAGEILLTSIDKDGTQSGYDISLTKAVSQAVRIPVIASGGAGRSEHFAEVFEEGEADAALAASIFHYRQVTVGQVKDYLKKKGVPVRI